MRPNPQFPAIWSHLLKKSLMENFIFLCSMYIAPKIAHLHSPSKEKKFSFTWKH